MGNKIGYLITIQHDNYSDIAYPFIIEAKITPYNEKLLGTKMFMCKEKAQKEFYKQYKYKYWD